MVLNDSWDKDDWALFLEMGTGKTKILIDNMAYLYDRGRINGAIILAPKGVYKNWIGEIKLDLPERIPYRIAAYESGGGQKVARQLAKIFETGFELHILLMNIEAIVTKTGYQVCQKFLGSHETFFIIDESTTIKNHKARRTKAALKLANYAVYRRIATGSPILQSPMDLWSQCAFLDPELLGHGDFYSFRNRYAETMDMIIGPRRFKKITGIRKENIPELAEKLKRFSHRIRKVDCVDLPDKIYETVEVEMSPLQAQTYKNLIDYAYVKFDKEQDYVSVEAVITLLIKLQQICSGFVRTEEGKDIDLMSDRLATLVHILGEVEGKAIIWANFQENVRRIQKHIEGYFGKYSVVDYYGETSPHEREENLAKFQDPDSKARFLVGTPATGGMGLTLVVANTVVYYSNSYNLLHRIQSEDRSHRIGQTEKVTYIDLISRGTVEEKIVAALKKKQDISKLIIDDGWKEWIF